MVAACEVRAVQPCIYRRVVQLVGVSEPGAQQQPLGVNGAVVKGLRGRLEFSAWFG
jgi:hypothetical protein